MKLPPLFQLLGYFPEVDPEPPVDSPEELPSCSSAPALCAVEGEDSSEDF
ncbi:MAG: RNA-dependent RNA-polymerase [Sandaracinaceae bacterium]|nr:RNA-dependent RNA-polymerase [Sandaracinaceae bacterium]MDW8245648.1 hypothetical protein [Sandaracinaceae bacterium]